MSPFEDEDQKYYDMFDKQEEDLRLNVYRLNETQPADKVARALELSQKNGLPRVAIESDMEAFEAEDDYENLKKLGITAPQLYRWLSQSPDNYAISKDDKNVLAEIESAFQKIGYAIKGGAQRFGAGGIAYERQAIGETMDYYRRLDEFEQREENRRRLGQEVPRGWRTVRTPDIGTISGFDLPVFYGNLDAAPGASGIVREQVRKALPESMRPMFTSQVDLSDAKAVRPILERKMAEVDARARATVEDYTANLEKARSENFVLNGLTQAVTSVTEMAPAMAAFFVLRGSGGSTLGAGAMGGQVFGAEYLEGIYNLNLDERSASDRALLQAGVELVTERISLGILDDIMRSDKGFFTKLGASMATEQIQEQAATLGNRLVDIPYVAPDTTISQFLADTPEAMANTAITTLFASGITNTTLLTLDSVVNRLLTDAVNAAESPGDKAIKTLLDKALNARTSKRSPQKMAEFVEGLAAQSNLETVVVDLDGVVQALAQDGIDPTETLSSLGVSPQELQTSSERFGEIEVKTSTLVTSAAMMAHRASIEPHIRSTQDAATPAQKEVLRAELDAAVKDSAARIQDAIETGKTTAEQVSQVREALRKRVMGAGTYPAGPQLNAMLDAITAMVTTLPRRTDKDVLAFYAARAPQVQGVVAGQTMQDKDALASEQADLPGSPQWEAAVAKGLDMSTEARMARAREMGFDTDKVFYHGTDADIVSFRTSSKGTFGEGVYLAGDAEHASLYADVPGGNVLPVYVKGKIATAADIDPSIPDAGGGIDKANDAYRKGFAGYLHRYTNGSEELIVFNPRNIRSVHAAFDPDQAASAMLLAQEGETLGRSTPTPDNYVPVEDVASVDGSFAFARGELFATNRDLKVAMQDRVQQTADESGADLLDDDYLVRMTERDARSALQNNANAVGWYDEKVRKAIAALTLLHPELETDAEARFAFTWALAVTSNGLKVDKNFELAEKVYRAWNKSANSNAARRMPTNVGIGTAKKAINKSLGLYNTLVKQHGVDVVLKFMTDRQTVKQVMTFTGENVSGENLTTEVFGAAALGPKIGNGFFMNLYGEFGQLTMDRWLMRTWGRWTATLITDYSRQAQDSRKKLTSLLKLLSPADKRAFEKVIGRPIKLREIDEVGIAIQKASQNPDLRAEMNRLGEFLDAEPKAISEILGPSPKGKFRISLGDEVRKRGNALAKYLDGQKEQPAGPPERAKIREVFSRALENMQKDYPALTMADLQALLWYPEKRLYDTAKAEEGKDIEGYEDDEAPDYANAARNLVISKGVAEAKVRDAYARIDVDVQAARRAGRMERGGDRGRGAEGVSGPQSGAQEETLGQEVVPPVNTLGQPGRRGGFFSALEKLVAESSTVRATADQWLDTMRNAPGIKQEEIEWTGLADWLAMSKTRPGSNTDGMVTRDEIVEYLRLKGVRMQLIIASDRPAAQSSGSSVFELEFDNGEAWDEPEAYENSVDYFFEEDIPQNVKYYTEADDWDDFVRQAYEAYLGDNQQEIRAELGYDEDAEITLESDRVLDHIKDVYSDSDRDQYIIDNNESYYRDRAEDAARRSYLDDPTYIYTSETNEPGRYITIFGNADFGYNIYDGHQDAWRYNGNRVNRQEIYSYNEAEIQARLYAEENNLLDYDLTDDEDLGETVVDEQATPLLDGVRRQSATKWKQYVSPGPHTNYREFKLTLPEVDGTFIYNTHFPDKNIVAFQRVTDRSLVAQPGGEKVESFHIDENQSDWHQKGRQGIYDTPAEIARAQEEDKKLSAEVLKLRQANYAAVEAAENELTAMPNFADVARDLGPFIDPSSVANRIRAIVGRYAEVSDDNKDIKFDDRLIFIELLDNFKDDDFVKAVMASIDKFKTIKITKHQTELVEKQLGKIRSALDNPIANAPFKGDAWINLSMKQAIIAAVAEGKTYISWSDSGVLKKRWGERYAQLYENMYDSKMPKMTGKLLGVKPVHIKDGLSSGQGYWIAPIPEAVRQKVIDEGYSLFQRDTEIDQARRGQYDLATRLITLFEQADVTTLMHEGAHWYLDMLQMMAKEPDAHPFVVQELANIEAWYAKHKTSPKMQAARSAYRIVEAEGRFTVYQDGKVRSSAYTSRAEAEARIDFIEMHEAFAETFEVYLQTGKAPNSGLRDAFQGFKRWITQLWKRMYGGGQPARASLDPDIVAVMDRMLSVDEEIDAQVEGIIQSADQQANELLKRGIITKRQRDAAIMNLETARESAKEDLMARLMEAKMREDEDWWQTERARVRRDVLREFDKSPVGRALSWLGYGTWKGDVPVAETKALDDAENEFYQPEVFELDPSQEGSANLLASLVPVDQPAPLSMAAMLRMSPDEVGEWYVNNVTEQSQDMGDGNRIVNLRFKSDDSAEKHDSHVNITIDNKGRVKALMFFRKSLGGSRLALPPKPDNITPEQQAERDEIAAEIRQRQSEGMRVFSRGIMALRHWSQLEQPTSITFSGSGAGQVKLYNYLLSRMAFDGYLTHRVTTIMGAATTRDGETTGEGYWEPAVQFVILRDGEALEDHADARSSKGLTGVNADGDRFQGVTARGVEEIRPVGNSARPVDRGGRTVRRTNPGSVLGQELAPPFYSALSRFVASSSTARAPSAQWKGMITNAPGIKVEEVEMSGVMDWLDLQEGPVTREALAAFVAANGVTVEEVVKGAGRSGRDPRLNELERQMLPLIEESDRILLRQRELATKADNQTITEEEKAERSRNVKRLQEVDDLLVPLRQEQYNLSSPSGADTKWSSFTLPGGENYTELLLRLPDSSAQKMKEYVEYRDALYEKYGKAFYQTEASEQELQKLAELSDATGKVDPQFRSSHWDEPNVLAHVRFKERIGPNGERVLALEEIQSDWHQAGRERGYKDANLTAEEKELQAFNKRTWSNENPLTIEEQARMDELKARGVDRSLQSKVSGVPNAPFKNNAWVDLVLKRMIRYAAENGFDSVAWIPGNIQNGQVVQAGDNRSDFYDKIVPNAANKLGKKYGARAERLEFDLGPDAAGSRFEILDAEGNSFGRFPSEARANGVIMSLLANQPGNTFTVSRIGPFVQFHSLPITPELAAAAMTEGFPLFQPGDPKGWGETAPPPDLPPMRLDLAATEQLYGKAAVDALPRAIKDRYRDQTSVDGMLAAARGAAKTLKRKPPKTLLQFIRARKKRSEAGKTAQRKQWGIKGASDELKAMDRGDLINEASGIHIDYMRELAEEAGYLPGGSTVNSLLDAIDKEARGDPVYSERDANEVLEIQSAQQWADWLSENGVDIFEPDQRKLKAGIAKVTRSTNADLKTPDEAAELLGFENGEQLLAALAAVGNREKFIEAETDRRMREEFGDPFGSGEFAEAARQAAERELKLRAAEIEIEALARALGETAASRLAKEMAMDALSLMTVKELDRWERFLDIERRELRNALKASQAGDIPKALTHKRRQLVNGHLAKAAREKSEVIEKTRKDLLTYFTSKGRRDKIAPDYLEKIEALLETYELRASKQGLSVQRKALSAKEYVEQMVADGREAEIAPEAMLLAAQADKKVWRGLTVDEVEYLAGTVRNMAHLGRTKNSLMKAQDKRRFDAVIADLVGTLMAAPSARKRGKSFSPGLIEDATIRLSGFDAKLTSIPDEFEWLDGKQGGALATTLGLPFEQADVRKLTMMRDATRKIRALWKELPPNLRKATMSKRVDTPELELPTNQKMTLMDVVIIGLNWGNAGNRQALMDGYGWDVAAVEAVLDRHLTDAHWNFIEGVWSLIGSYKADAFALEKRITGVEPKAVEGITFTLPSGRVVKGQYYPLKYDAEQESALSVKQGKLNEKQMLSEMGLSFSKPMTKTGHLISRVGSGGKPVAVSLDVFYEHIENVVHDIAFRPAVIDAFRIIRDPRFTQAYIDAAGKAQYDRLMPWLHSIATNNRARFSSTFARTMTFFRGGWSISMMGYSFSTATQQLTGYVEAATEIGPRWVLQGALKTLSLGPASFWREWDFARERSEYLSNRVAFGKERDIRAVRTNPRPGGPLQAIGENAFAFLSVMDAIVGTGVWRGAFDKAMAGKVNGIASQDEEQAVAFADRAVQRSLSAGEVYRLPEIMREGEISALLTMVYSYGAKTYNRQRVRNLRVRYGQMGLPAYVTSTLIAFLAVPILAALLAGRLWPDDEEEWEERGDDVANEVLMNAAGTTPFVRDMVSLLARPQYGYQLSPVQSTFEQIGVATRSAAEGKTFDSEFQARQAVMALATVFRLPGSQLFETGDYVYDLYMGEEDPMADPADAAREALISSQR